VQPNGEGPTRAGEARFIRDERLVESLRPAIHTEHDGMLAADEEGCNSPPGAYRPILPSDRPAPRRRHSMTWMSLAAHMSLRIFGHTVTDTSPRWAFFRIAM